MAELEARGLRPGQRRAGMGVQTFMGRGVPPDPVVVRLNRFAATLTGCGFFLPTGLAIFGQLVLGDVVVLTVQGVLVVVLAWVTANYLARERSKRIQAWASLAVAVLICAEMSTLSISKAEARNAMLEYAQAVNDALAARGETYAEGATVARLRAGDITDSYKGRGLAGYFRGMAADVRRTAVDDSALRDKIAAAGLDHALDPDQLVSAAGIAQSRARLRAYEALMAERLRLAKAALQRGDRVLNAAELSGNELAYSMQGQNRHRDAVLNHNGRLDEAGRAAIAARERILDFAQANLGKLSVKGNALAFSNAALKTAYEALVQKLDDARSEEESAQAAADDYRTLGLEQAVRYMEFLVR